MKNRSEFTKELAQMNLSHAERAVALLWYYRQTQEFEERSASALANDLHELGFPKPNVTLLRRSLSSSRLTIRGRQKGTFQVDVRKLPGLDQKYSDILKAKKVEVEGKLLPIQWFVGTRLYLERLVHQINGTYEFGFYDACATMCRRLVESLIIEVYVKEKRHHEIQRNGVFLSLEPLINYICSDPKLSLSRNSPPAMKEIKQIGDTAAHDRVYITGQQDIDDVKLRYRRLVQELMTHAGIAASASI
jgi:hypothetical protein